MKPAEIAEQRYPDFLKEKEMIEKELAACDNEPASSLLRIWFNSELRRVEGILAEYDAVLAR